MAEWFNALVLKTSEGESPPRVRISPPPPVTMRPPEHFDPQGCQKDVNLFSLDLDLGLQDRVVHFTELLDKLLINLPKHLDLISIQ